MGLSIDASKNYLVWGNTEAVSYTSHGSTDRLYALPLIKRRVLTFRELAASGGVYTSRNRVWLLPATIAAAATFTTPTLTYFKPDGAGGVNRVCSNIVNIPTATPGVSPKPADWLTDSDGIRWTVLEADLQTLKSTWKLTTISLVLAYDLRDMVSILRPTITQDAAGSRIADYSAPALYANVPARIQPESGAIADERGQRLTKQSFTVYLGQQVTVKQGDRLTDQNDLIYEIMGDSSAERIDTAQQLSVEIRGW